MTVMLTAAEIADMVRADAQQRARYDSLELVKRGIVPPVDEDPIGELDEDAAALLCALNEWSPDATRAKGFNPAVHPRNPKGSPGGGRFRSLVDRIKDALTEHHKNGGKGDPLEGFDREQLRKVAKTRGITLVRNEGRDSIAKKLLADLSAGDKKPTSGPDQARARQARIDKARSVAKVTAEAEEAYGNGGTPAQIRRVVAQQARIVQHATPGQEHVAKVAEDIAAQDTAEGMLRVARQHADRAGLIRIGDAGETVAFDPALHRPLPNTSHRRGELVAVVRPGHRYDPGDGEVVIEKAVVDEADNGTAAPTPPTPKKPAGKARPAAASKFHLPGDNVADLAKASRSKDAERASLAGGESANTELVTTGDGRKFVTKRAHDWGDTSAEAQADVIHDAEAEQLASLVGRTIGAPVPRVYRSGVDRVWMDWADGRPIGDLGEIEMAEVLATRDAKLIGLLDQLIRNNDRNGGNLLVHNGHLTGIDHGYSWLRHQMEGPAGPLPTDIYRHPADWFGSDGQWIDNPLTQRDVRVLRQRLEGLRPSFEHVGHGEWLDYTLGRLDLLAQHAKGTVDLID